MCFLLSGLSLTLGAQADVGKAWMQYATPEDAGYSSLQLRRARTRAEAIGSAAVMVVDNAHVIVAWGDVERPFKCHSVRKSFLSALYGFYVDDGTIDRETTIAELGLDDIDPLTDTEKRARIVDLLRARSGIYHRAAKETKGTDAERPARGSHAPSTTPWA